MPASPPTRSLSRSDLLELYEHTTAECMFDLGVGRMFDLGVGRRRAWVPVHDVVDPDAHVEDEPEDDDRRKRPAKVIRPRELEQVQQQQYSARYTDDGACASTHTVAREPTAARSCLRKCREQECFPVRVDGVPCCRWTLLVAFSAPSPLIAASTDCAGVRIPSPARHRCLLRS